jgi:hypothetical protein
MEVRGDTEGSQAKTKTGPLHTPPHHTKTLQGNIHVQPIVLAADQVLNVDERRRIRVSQVERHGKTANNLCQRHPGGLRANWQLQVCFFRCPLVADVPTSTLRHPQVNFVQSHICAVLMWLIFLISIGVSSSVPAVPDGHEGGEGGGGPRRNSCFLLLVLVLTTADTTSAAGGNQTDLATRGTVAVLCRRVTNVLMVTTTVRVLDGVHGHTTNLGP